MHPPESPNLDGANQTFLDFWTLSQERKEDKKERCRGGLAGLIKAQIALTVRRDPQKIPSTKCPRGTLNLATFVWMCLISHRPVMTHLIKRSLSEGGCSASAFLFLGNIWEWSRRSDLNR
jgi:hypothetical protein